MKIISKALCAVLLLSLLTGVGFAQSVVQDSAVDVQCGSIIEGEFSDNFNHHTYRIDVNAGDSIQVIVEPLSELTKTFMFVVGPTRTPVAGSSERVQINTSRFEVSSSNIYTALIRPTINTNVLPSSGTYDISIVNFSVGWYSTTNDAWSNVSSSSGPGLYTMFISCTRRDGTEIEAGSIADTETELNLTDPDIADALAFAPFTGFGFPGLDARDFSDGIELPLILGQAQTAPIARDVALYTYDASAEEVVTLNISRASGDLSIGVTVINKATNEIIFIGGLPSSNNLSVELTFPTDGTYAIGLFRLDTAERSGTSGAVQVVLE